MPPELNPYHDERFEERAQKMVNSESVDDRERERGIVREFKYTLTDKIDLRFGSGAKKDLKTEHQTRGSAHRGRRRI